MKRTYSPSSGFLKATILATALAVITLGGFETASAATAITDGNGTAANTTIRNTVTVDYKNNSNVAMTAITQSVDITVALIDTTPTLTLVSTTPQTLEMGAAYDFEYTILSNANGPDTYNLTVASFVQSAGISGSTNGFFSSTGGSGSISSVDLGATSVATGTTIAASGNTVVTVPRDLANDGTVNGLAVNDTVVVKGVVFTVSAVSDAAGFGTATITLTGPGSGSDVTVVPGDLIQEKATFYLRITAGSATADATITTNIYARDAALPGQGQDVATANSQTVVNVRIPSLTVTKFVRNVTTPVAGGGTTVSINNDGSGPYNYYTSGVSGKPGETLEYLIRITNDAGVNPAGTAKGVKISDPIPQFTTYVTSSMRLDPGTGTWGALNDNLNGGDAGEWDSTGKVIYIYAGTGGVDTGALANDGTGGNLADNTTTYGSYRVTID